MKPSPSIILRIAFFFPLIALFIASVSVLSGCGEDDVNNELPSEISSFVVKYYPNTPVSSFSKGANGTYIVEIRNGATITFGSDMKWTEIDGNGVPLPSMMIMDECPAPLYGYIEEMEAVDGVYLLSRNSEDYRVEFLDTYITYVISTGKVTYPEEKD